MMKKLFAFISLFLIALIFSGCSLNFFAKNPPVDNITASPGAFTGVKVDIILDFGDGGVATSAAVEAKTPLQALEKATYQKNLILKTIYSPDQKAQVQAVGEKENTKDQAWIFYVNGKPADKAADKYDLKAGDKVEWKFKKRE